MTKSDAVYSAPTCDRLSRRFNAKPTGEGTPDRRRRQAPPPALVFERLLPRYERHIRGEAPIAGLDADGAVATMRRQLAAAGALAGGRTGSSTRH